MKYMYLFLLFVFFGCASPVLQKADVHPKKYLAENIIIVVIDGPRFSETWGDTTHKLIPQTKRLSKEGCVFTKFKNNGPTYTMAGHTAITTGNYQHLNNRGHESPLNPSIFQLYEKQYQDNKTWIITSKGKLTKLSDCTDPEWKGKHNPETNCGNWGLGAGSGDRDDAQTMEVAKEILTSNHPKLALIQFKEPDISGHNGDWEGYLQGIKTTDKYIGEIWDFIQHDSIYADKTALFVTNDHGRHSNGWLDGFRSHGDGCRGCRHINLLALGPDFKKGVIITQEAEQIDLPVTASEILGIKGLQSKGRVLKEIFNDLPKE